MIIPPTSPPGTIASQYLGLFTNATVRFTAPLLAVEFDTGQNPKFNDIDDNHIGIDLNNIESTKSETAGYYDSVNGSFVSYNMRNGLNVQAWIDFNGPNFEINVSIAPAGVSRPRRPTLTFCVPIIANYVSADMFVGFSASNTTNLPVFFLKSLSSSLSIGAIVGIVIGCVVFLGLNGFGSYLIWRKLIKEDDEEEVEEWE